MGDDDYRFTYEHYRVPVGHKDSIPKTARETWLDGVGTHSAVDFYAKRFDDAYRAEYLLSVDRRTKDTPVYYPPGYEPHTHGGKTICRVWWNENLLASATSWCSINDPFSYRVGRHISRGRALANLASLQEVAIG